MVPRAFESPRAMIFAEDIADNRIDNQAGLCGPSGGSSSGGQSLGTARPAPSDGVPGNGDYHEGNRWVQSHHWKGPAANSHSPARFAKACHTLAIRAVSPAKCIDDGQDLKMSCLHPSKM